MPGPPARSSAVPRWRALLRLPREVRLLLVAFLAVTAVVLAGWLLAADTAAQPWFTRQAGGGAGRAALGVVAALGDLVVALPLLAVAALWRAWRERSLRPAAAATVTVLALGASVSLLKVLVGRTSPGEDCVAVLAGGRSYPSGHAATATVCLLLVAELVAGDAPARWRRALVGAALVLSAAVAWATVALGFHWVSDVVGGVLLGALLAGSARRWLGVGRPADTVGTTNPGR